MEDGMLEEGMLEEEVSLVKRLILLRKEGTERRNLTQSHGNILKNMFYILEIISVNNDVDCRIKHK